MKGSEAVWAVALLQPVTVREVADQFDVPTENADSALRKCWYNGIIVRRKRPATGTASDRRAYEYALRVPEAGEEGESIPADALDEATA